MLCPACGQDGFAQGRSIAFCRCGHRWLLTTADQHQRTERATYTPDYYAPDAAFVAFAQRFTVAELLPRCRPPARLLDVGCGAGEFMEIAEGLGYETTGIDVSAAAAEICRGKGLDARSGDLLTEQFPTGFDVITMWDVVEHLRDPRAMLRRAAELLNEDGVLFAKVPSFGSLSVRLSDVLPRLSGLLLGAPGHVQYFTQTSLQRLGWSAGFLVDCEAGGDIRSQRETRSIRKRLGRLAQRVVKGLSGDHNLFLFASKHGHVRGPSWT